MKKKKKREVSVSFRLRRVYYLSHSIAFDTEVPYADA